MVKQRQHPRDKCTPGHAHTNIAERRGDRPATLASGRSGRSSGPLTPAWLAAALAAALVRRFFSKIPIFSTSAKCVLSRVVTFAATPS